jgi:hypothetical protein
MCDLVEETLGLDYVDDELEAAFRAARETADAIERGDDVDPGDIGAAADNLRARSAPPWRAPQDSNRQPAATMRVNASTTAGSNCAPAQRCSSASASSEDRPAR